MSELADTCLVLNPVHNGLKREMLDRHSFRICHSESKEKTGGTAIEWEKRALGTF